MLEDVHAKWWLLSFDVLLRPMAFALNVSFLSSKFRHIVQPWLRRNILPNWNFIGENIEEARSGKGIIEIDRDVLWPEMARESSSN